MDRDSGSGITAYMIRYDGVMIDVVKRRGKQGCRYAVATTLQGSKSAVEAHPDAAHHLAVSRDKMVWSKIRNILKDSI